MSKGRPPRLSPAVLKELEGLDWSWHQGTKHWHLMIDGRLITLQSYGSARKEGLRNFHRDQNLRAEIRRYRRSKVAA